MNTYVSACDTAGLLLDENRCGSPGGSIEISHEDIPAVLLFDVDRVVDPIANMMAASGGEHATAS